MQRLKKRHSRNLHAPPADAGKLLGEQSLKNAALAGAVAIVAMMASWVALAAIFDRYFPWYPIVQGYIVGHAVRRFGHGVEWPFPVLAASITAAGAFLGSFLVALFLTGREFRTGALELVDEISWHTVSVFAVRNFGADGIIYMSFAAVLAAFYASRRLNRQEAVALRRLSERRD